MKGLLLGTLLVAICISLADSQGQCEIGTCTQREQGTGHTYDQALKGVAGSSASTNPTRKRPRSKRDTGYGKPQNQVIEHGKVIVMPPPGQAPQKSPQPGQRGGGARPEDNPYIANMAPEGTVPVAIFPPFEKSPLYPKKCVIFSELTDFEDQQQDYGNIQIKPTYSAPRVRRQITEETNESLSDEVHQRSKRAGIFDFFRPAQRRPVKHLSSYSAPAPAPAYGAPPPSYAPPTEPPVRVIYRTFGYVCEITVSVDVCYIGKDCEEDYGYGSNNNNNHNRNNAVDTYESRRNQFLAGKGDSLCVKTQAAGRVCDNAKNLGNQYPGLAKP